MKKTANNIEEVRLCEMRLDKTQSRARLDPDAVQDYADLLRSGVELPPLVVFFDGADYWMSDGFHRHAAACNLGLDTYPCQVHRGGMVDALRVSVGANNAHGVRRTNEDKRHAVEMALSIEEWSDLSNAFLAALCGASDWLVADVRKVTKNQHRELEVDNGKPTKTRVGKDGRRRSVAAKAGGRAAKSQLEKSEDFDTFDPRAIEAAQPEKVDIKGLAAPYKSAVNDLSRIVRQFEDLAKEERTGAHLADKITRIKHDLEEGKRAISSAEPVSVCGKCSGTGCRSCANTGFWTRAVAKSRK